MNDQVKDPSALCRREPQYHSALRFMGVQVLSLNALRTMLDPHQEEEAVLKHRSGTTCPFDIILISRRDAFKSTYSVLQDICREVPIIFDTVDLHFLREARARTFKANHSHDMALLSAIFGLEATATAEDSGANDVELQYIAVSTVTLVVSPFEVEEIHRYLPDANVVVVSNIHSLDPTDTPFPSRHGAVFTGNFNHLPNRCVRISTSSVPQWAQPVLCLYSCCTVSTVLGFTGLRSAPGMLYCTSPERCCLWCMDAWVMLSSSTWWVRMPFRIRFCASTAQSSTGSPASTCTDS